jgi:hypothetical protein
MGGMPFCAKLQRLQVRPVAARAAQIDRFSGQVFEAIQLRRGRPRHDQFLDVSQPRIGEIDDSLSFGRLCQIAGGDVALAGGELGKELIARDRHEDDLNLLYLQIVARVEPVLERGAKGGDGAHLLPLVDEEQRLAVRHQDADDFAFQHAIEVARPGPDSGQAQHLLMRDDSAAFRTLLRLRKGGPGNRQN